MTFKEFYLHSRKIRVFLSSTFQDMQSERDYLVKNTFPALQREASKRNIDFSIVDLRWGVTEEEAHQGKVIEICLKEIEKTRPYFIGLVGERYGWCPSKMDVAKNKRLKNLYPWVNNCIQEGLSMTEIEMRYGLKGEYSAQYAHFYFKDHSISRELQEDQPKLKALRDLIEQKANNGECSLYHYRTPKQLGENIYDSLLSLMEEMYPLNTNDPIQLLQDSQNYKIQQMQSVYENSRAIIQLDVKYSNRSSTPWCWILVGEKGIGKTALLCNWRANDPRIIRTLLDNETNTAQKALSHLKAELTARERKKANTNEELPIWIVDGLENLQSDEDRTMRWLLSPEVDGVQLFLSTTDITLATCAQGVLADTRLVERVKMDSPFKVERIEIIKSYLLQFAKGLSEEQIDVIASNPLFDNIWLMKLFLQELIQFGVYEQLDAFMKTYLRAETADQLIEQIFKRLENDYGEQSVRTYMGLLCLTQYGIPETHLQRVLGMNAIRWSSFSEAVRTLSYYSQGKFSLMPQVYIVAQKCYLNDEEQTRIWRKDLLTFFKKQYRNYVRLAYRKNFFYAIAAKLVFGLNAADNDYPESLIYKNEILRLRLELEGPHKVFDNPNVIATVCSDNILMNKLAEYIQQDPTRLKKIINRHLLRILDPSSLTFLLRMFLQDDKDRMRQIRDHINQLHFVWGKQKFLNELDSIINQDNNTAPEITWSNTALEAIDFTRMLSLTMWELPWVVDAQRIERVRDEGEKLLERYKEKEEIAPDDYEMEFMTLYLMLAYCALAQNDLEQAQLFLSKAVASEKRADEFNLIHFLVAFKAGDQEYCSSFIKRQEEPYIKNKIKPNAILYAILIYYYLRYNPDKAQDYYEQLLNLHADQPDQAEQARYSVALFMQARGEFHAAAELYEKLLEVIQDSDSAISYLIDAANAYNEAKETESERRVRYLLIQYFEQNDDKDSIVYNLSRIAETYVYDTNFEGTRNARRDIIKQYIAVYQKIDSNLPDTQLGEEANIILRLKYDNTICSCALYHHLWTNSEPLVIEAAKEAERLFPQLSKELRAEWLSCLFTCLLAAEQYEKALPYLEQINDPVLANFLRMRLAQNPNALREYQMRLTAEQLKLWEQNVRPVNIMRWYDEMSEGVLTNLYAKYWPGIYEDFEVPIMEDAAIEDSPFRPLSMAALLVYYYATENHKKLATYLRLGEKEMKRASSSEYPYEVYLPLEAVLQCSIALQ